MGEIIWAPWRMDYMMSEKTPGCIFCEKPRQADDRANYLVWRGTAAFVMLNLYPYNNGHLMIIPYAHVASLTALNASQRADLLELTASSEAILRQTFRPAGFNIGLNLGAAAGAGIAEHLHIHIVPRWAGDTNFMTVISELRVLPQTLEQTYDLLLPHFQALSPTASA